MNQNSLQVDDNMVVSISYTLVASNEASNEASDKEAGWSKTEQAQKQIVQGRKQIVPGLEKALYGMSVGDEKDVTVEPLQGYGDSKPAAVQTLSRTSVPSFANATEGQRLKLVVKKSGEVRRATVVNVGTDTIVLDFNHPFAGKTLRYHLRVDDIRYATPKELETGRVVGS